MSVDISGSGSHHDTGKPPLELVEPSFITGISTVLQWGVTTKYDLHNWKKGIKYSKIIGSTLRHVWAWWSGELLDPESGISHLYHAACDLMFLCWYEDQWKKSQSICDTSELIAANHLNDRYPHHNGI